MLQRVLSRRGLCLLFLAATVGLACSGWLRPPLSNDIRGFELPLFGSAFHGPAAEELLYGPRPFVWPSPGVLLFGLVAVGVAVAFLKPARFPVAAGLLLCGGLAGLSSALFNHPELVDLLNQQYEQRRQLVRLLEAAGNPVLPLTDSPRVTSAPDTAEQRITLFSGLIYLRTGGPLLILPALVLLLSTRGRLSRRLGHLGLWGVAGLACAGVVAQRRLSAEWHWERAVRADRQGRTTLARQQAEAAVSAFPELSRLEGSWLFFGKLDYRGGSSAPAADCFRARQLADNGALRRAVGLMEELAGGAQPAPTVGRWAANRLSELGFALFQQEQPQAAEAAWQRAGALDPGQVYRRLHVLVLQACVEREDPTVIAAGLDPLLARLAEDRALRAALLAMLGDSYFQAGRYGEARERYAASMRAYGLPKHINYRAQHGLLGL